MRTRLVPVLLLAGVVALAGCGEPRLGDAGGEVELAGEWELVDGSDADGSFGWIGDFEVTAEFDDGQLSGQGACNQYGGEYTLDGEALRITEQFWTEMACDPAVAMDADEDYREALRAVERAARDGDELVLTGPEVELRYEAPLAATAA